MSDHEAVEDVGREHGVRRLATFMAQIAVRQPAQLLVDERQQPVNDRHAACLLILLSTAEHSGDGLLGGSGVRHAVKRLINQEVSL